MLIEGNAEDVASKFEAQELTARVIVRLNSHSK